jgi:hypothetical protein
LQYWNQRLVHNPREIKKGQHVDWRPELQLLGNLANDDGKNAVDDTCLGVLFLGFARPTGAVEPVREQAKVIE